MAKAVSPPPTDSVYRLLASFWFRHGYKLLALIPFAGLVWLIGKYGVDVPFWDQWDLVPLLDKMYAGHLSLSDVWAQHNEHRPLVPQLIMLGLARLTGWNIRCELAVSVALAVGVFLVFAWQIRSTQRTLSAAGLRWAIPASALIVFSLSQYQNWLWGWQIQMLLNLLAAVGGIVLLARPLFDWRKVAAAAVLGVVASYSFANGLLFWPIGLGMLFVATRSGKQRRLSIALWLLVSILTFGSYLWRYVKPSQHPPLSVFLDYPLAYSGYVFKFLGGIGAQYYSGPLPGQQAERQLAGLMGLVGTLAVIWTTKVLLQQKWTPLPLNAPGLVAADVSRRNAGSSANAPTDVGGYSGPSNRAASALPGLPALLPYLAMMAYSIGTALITGVGRIGMGADEALESRYCTMAVPFWVSLVVLLLILLHRPLGTVAARPRPRKTWEYYQQAAALSLLIGIVVLLGFSSVWAIEGAANMSAVQAECRATMLEAARHPEAGIDLSALTSQGPYLKGLVEERPILVKYRLSLFRKPANETNGGRF